ncbi:MAG: hypothetical protein H7308_14405 [Chthonomonadaceae bacterium]|nr:hypothetical protein [Chthonomonadaceae bacterium]
MQTLDSQTKSSPLWVRVLLRLVSAIVAAGVMSFIGKLHSDPVLMRNGIYFGVLLGLVWGKLAIGAVLRGWILRG